MAGSGPIDPNTLPKLLDAARSGVPYTDRPGLVPIDEYTYQALGRATGLRGAEVMLGGEPHVFVPGANSMLVLAVGRDEQAAAAAPILGAA